MEANSSVSADLVLVALSCSRPPPSRSRHRDGPVGPVRHESTPERTQTVHTVNHTAEHTAKSCMFSRYFHTVLHKVEGRMEDRVDTPAGRTIASSWS